LTRIVGRVPREDFSEEQIKMLARNTQQMGSGLVMLGGPNSFGAGGWDRHRSGRGDAGWIFQIKNKQIVPIGALSDANARFGNGERQCTGKGKLRMLRLGRWNQDYCGVIHWEGTSPNGCGPLAGGGIVKIGDGDIATACEAGSIGCFPAICPLSTVRWRGF